MTRGDSSEALLNALPAVFYLHNQDLHFLRWNRELERVTGRTAGDMAAVGALELFAGPERGLVAARIRRAFDVGASSVEAHLVCIDGTRTPFFFTCRRTEINGQLCLIGVGIEITQRRQAEVALRERDERLRLATQAAGLGTFDWDVSRDRIVWSRRHEELWGFAPGEFGGTYADFAARVHPDDLAGVNAEVERCIAARVPLAAEFRVRWPDGTILWIHGRGKFAFDADGRPRQMLGVVMDVTERRRAEEALRESEPRFRTVVDQAADAIVITSTSGGYDHCNAAACTLFGYSCDEFLSLPLVALVVADQQPKAAITAARTVSGHAQASVWQFQRKDGSTFIGEAHVNRLPDDRLIAVIRDVTERHRAEGQLRDYAVSLRALTEHLERVRDEEATRIARELHDELGQQLTGLRLDLGWLSKHLPERDAHASAEPVQHRIGEMIRHIDQTIHTVRRISTDLRPAILDDLGLCAAVEWQAEEFARRTGLQCSARVPPDEISIGRAPAAAMFRVLREALTNVIRHAGAQRVDIVLEQIGAAVRLRITDDGRGLPPEALESRSLGLLGMRERAEAHGGSVTFGSPPHGGTTVIVELPV